jgi:nucleotide-binding universal stress UspA family protein
MHPITNILVPTDFSQSCQAAIDSAVELARTFDASLTLVHVWQIPAYTATAAMYGGADLVTPIEEAASACLRAEVERLEKLVPNVTSELRCGVPWQEIVEVAIARAADLIVIGTHGRTGFRHALLGSVAEKVVRISPVPVLTVRPTGAPTTTLSTENPAPASARELVARPAQPTASR